jgi:hypothetical protein
VVEVYGVSMLWLDILWSSAFRATSDYCEQGPRLLPPRYRDPSCCFKTLPRFHQWDAICSGGSWWAKPGFAAATALPEVSGLKAVEAAFDVSIPRTTILGQGLRGVSSGWEGIRFRDSLGGDFRTIVRQ